MLPRASAMPGLDDVSDVEALARGVRVAVFDFDGVFTDNTVYVLDDGTEAVRCNRSDGIGIARLRRCGIESIILSSEVNPVVGHRAHKLGIRCIQGRSDKLAALEALRAELDVSLEEIAYVGNDTNDLPCLERVGLPITVAGAHPDVAPVGRYVTACAGGAGAVREVCDLIARQHEADG